MGGGDPCQAAGGGHTDRRPPQPGAAPDSNCAGCEQDGPGGTRRSVCEAPGLRGAAEQGSADHLDLSDAEPESR